LPFGVFVAAGASHRQASAEHDASRAWLGAGPRLPHLQQGALGTTFAVLALFLAFGG
jgi:hypothetical protein